MVGLVMAPGLQAPSKTHFIITAKREHSTHHVQRVDFPLMDWTLRGGCCFMHGAFRWYLGTCEAMGPNYLFIKVMFLGGVGMDNLRRCYFGSGYSVSHFDSETK